MVTENLFEARFMFVQELARLGADIRVDGHHAMVRGEPRLSGGAGRGHRHPGRRRPGRGRAGGRRGDRGAAAATTSTAGTPHFDEHLRALGADVRREADPLASLPA